MAQLDAVGVGVTVSDPVGLAAAARASAVGTIINNSWGGLYWTNDQVTNEFVNAWSDFILNRDGLVVFANGNSGTDARYRDNPSNNAALPSSGRFS